LGSVLSSFSVPGRGRLLSSFTRRFRLGFALLRGGSRIDQHRAGVLSLDGSTEHSVLTPLTIPASGLRNTHAIVPSLCYLSLVHLLPLWLPKFVPGSPGETLFFPSLQHPSLPTGMDCVLVIRDSKVSWRFRGTRSWVLGGSFRVDRS